ncbi:nucleotidyltransferase family protein [Spirosoma sp. KCTC 42546]|uniref:nucleotidyltransferase family protein n=1 Tax=Spirosoma sp. KCTC 42546 TaxID=2520506 RepID=UPI00115A4368|nr:nucleotidyltransferase family protein [Spirosoma sp. KCTC 42546]QDK82412.1 nucleotidyltransferase family protein [Spirosoma sp. KCTC 42546]
MSSIYTKLLVESINVSLNNVPDGNLKYLLKHTKYDWDLLKQKTAYHGISPILFDVIRKVDKDLVDSNYFDVLKNSSIRQSVFDLLASQEILSLLKFLESHNIEVLPSKGILFIHELYDKKSIRESFDLDILVRRKDAVKALKLLVEEAKYHFILPDDFIEKKTTDDIIHSLLSISGHHEVGLKRADSEIHIDFHWDAYEDFYQYQLPTGSLFKDQANKFFFNSICKIPSKEAIFWMLIIHHGGREMWLRLKYFCDLFVFYQKYGNDIDWGQIVLEAEKFKMKRIIINAFYCLETLFNIKLPDSICLLFSENNNLEKNYNKISNSWDVAQSRNATILAKIRFYILYFSLQDDNYSYIQHIKHSFQKRSVPNPLETEKRIIVFPKKFIMLNFFGKVATAMAIYIGFKKRN